MLFDLNAPPDDAKTITLAIQVNALIQRAEIVADQCETFFDGNAARLEFGGVLAGLVEVKNE